MVMFARHTVGKLVGAMTAVMGVCVVALLTGIVATAFANQISRRQDMFEAEIVAALSDGVITQARWSDCQNAE